MELARTVSPTVRRRVESCQQRQGIQGVTRSVIRAEAEKCADCVHRLAVAVRFADPVVPDDEKNLASTPGQPCVYKSVFGMILLILLTLLRG